MFVACQIPSTGTPDTPLRFKYFSDRPPLPPPGDVATFFRRIGFLYGSGEVNRGFLVFHQTIATVPCWFVAAGTLLLPLRFGVVMRGRWRRESRLRRGLCTACGYDLRETVGRCPECGMTTEAEAKT